MNPFRIEEPFIVSFSGGRTSGYMLRCILDEFGGKMPEGGKVIFANTGKERQKTLQFVERVGQRWDVPIVWLEYDSKAQHKFREVGYENASRCGEPFTDLIRQKMMLPNPVMRFCTQWLKIKVSNRYTRHVLGWKHYANCIGLRADEPRRTAKLKADPKSSPGEEPYAPLAKAGINLAHVTAFWNANDFDLGLAPHEGNCDLCFLKGVDKTARIMRDRPDLAGWWIERERERERVGKTRSADVSRFRANRPSYAQLLKQVEEQPELPLAEDESLTECHCTD